MLLRLTQTWRPPDQLIRNNPATGVDYTGGRANGQRWQRRE